MRAALLAVLLAPQVAAAQAAPAPPAAQPNALAPGQRVRVRPAGAPPLVAWVQRVGADSLVVEWSALPSDIIGRRTFALSDLCAVERPAVAPDRRRARGQRVGAALGAVAFGVGARGRTFDGGWLFPYVRLNATQTAVASAAGGAYVGSVFGWLLAPTFARAPRERWTPVPIPLAPQTGCASRRGPGAADPPGG